MQLCHQLRGKRDTCTKPETLNFPVFGQRVQAHACGGMHACRRLHLATQLFGHVHSTVIFEIVNLIRPLHSLKACRTDLQGPSRQPRARLCHGIMMNVVIYRGYQVW